MQRDVTVRCLFEAMLMWTLPGLKAEVIRDWRTSGTPSRFWGRVEVARRTQGVQDIWMGRRGAVSEIGQIRRKYTI